MSLHEIVLPETKPETEWIAGRALQKVSPTFDHASLQTAMLLELLSSAGNAGYVRTEWRFRLAPAREIRRPLVPDVAYVAAERVHHLSREELQALALAPNVAVEILSPDDRRSDVNAKIEVYLRSGTQLVVVLDPATRTCELHDTDGNARVLHGDDVLEHKALPGFTLVVEPFFDRALRLL